MKTAAIMGIAVMLGAGGALAMKLTTASAPVEVTNTPIIDANEAMAPISSVKSDPSGAPGLMPTNATLNPGDPSATMQPATMAATTKGGSETICGQTVPLMADGRLMNHYRYGQAAGADLVPAPAGFGSGNCAQVHRDMAPALTRMIADAKKQNPAVGNALMGVSCFRSVQRQTDLFCRPDRIKSRGIAGQAKWVAPGGFSEHATGLTIDFGDRTRTNCHVSPCFKDTGAGRWLAANAGKYGFEMSFPSGNIQGVSYEPWHFRYVGSDNAKQVFATARTAR